jgi:hypothetical protein
MGELQIDQDIAFQRRSWTAQRVAWVVMTLVALAALLGLFGPGLLGAAEAGDRNGPLWIEYDRFGRLQAEATSVKFHLGPGSSPGGTTRISIARPYLERFEITHTAPEPESTEVFSDRYVYVFRNPDPTQSGLVTFYLEPERAGPCRASVGIEGGPSLEIRQFVYP